MVNYFPLLLQLMIFVGISSLFTICAALFKETPSAFVESMAREVSPAEAPELWQSIRTSAEHLRTEPPDRLIVGLDLDCYVTELAVVLESGLIEGKTLYLSLPLMKQLSEEEILSVIGHELGHFIGEDTKLTHEFYPLHFKVRTLMKEMASGWIFSWPSLQLLYFFDLR